MSKRIYDTAAWARLRNLKLQTNPFCEACQAEGRYTLAEAVDHRVAISQGGAHFPTLDGLASLCTRCHSIKTARGAEAGAVRSSKPRKGCDVDGTPLDTWHPWGKDSERGTLGRLARPHGLRPCLSPLTIVFGPPGGGKSHHATHAMMAGDRVLDLDLIMAELSHLPLYHAPAPWVGRALSYRNAELSKLANVRLSSRTFLIVGAPTGTERDWWRDKLRPDEHALIMPPRATAIERIQADERRGAMKGDHIRACYRWYSRFTPSAADIIAHSGRAPTVCGQKSIVSSDSSGRRSQWV